MNVQAPHLADSRMEAARASAALALRYEAIAANLANAETDGFKRVLGTVRLESGHGPRAALRRDHSQGALTQTGAREDLALEGPGYFAVDVDGDVAYTRTLRFSTDSERYVVDQRGLRVLGQGGPLRAPDRTAPIEVGPDGQVVSRGERVGQLALSTFDDPEAMRAVGPGLFQPTDSQIPRAASDTAVRQGARERSNVDPIEEMVALMTVQRHFQASQRVMQRSDTMTENLIRSLR